MKYIFNKNPQFQDVKIFSDENDPEYLMDHTVVLFLLNPENKVQEYFTQRKSPGQIIFETHSGK